MYLVQDGDERVVVGGRDTAVGGDGGCRSLGGAVSLSHTEPPAGRAGGRPAGGQVEEGDRGGYQTKVKTWITSACRELTSL